MEVKDLLRQAREIWGDDRMELRDILIRLGVDYGDLCRIARGADKDRALNTPDEVKKELGNILFSVIRWADDLGYDPEECVRMAIEAQKRFVAANKNR